MKSIFLTILVFILSFQITKAQWEQVSNGLPNVGAVYSLAYSGNIIFSGTRDSGVYTSTNNGANWAQTSLTNRQVRALAVNANNIFAGTVFSGAGVYLSTNNGTNWTQSLNGKYVNSLAVNGNYVFAGCILDGVYRSTNNGITWASSGLFNQDILAIAVSGNNVFAGMVNYIGVYLSTDNGTNWAQTSLNNRQVRALAVSVNKIFAGTALAGVYISTNNGTNWTQTSLNDRTIWSFEVSENNVFAGTTGYGVYVSNDNGTTWTQRNEGLGNPHIYDLCISNNYIFASVGVGGVYRRLINQLTGINPISGQLPSGYALEQNYPNPFNPTTNIKFHIPKSGGVRIKVYDNLGKEIETLVNESLNPGTYEVDWDASQFSCGVYYYRLITIDFTDTKKMLLIK